MVSLGKKLVADARSGLAQFSFPVRRALRAFAYVWMTDSGGRAVVIGSACLWISFQMLSSRRKTVVTRTAAGV